MLECLPEFNTVNKPFVIRWGKQSDETAIFYLTSDIIEAYDEITAWRKNVFLVPYGRAGRDFIDQISLHINEWNNSPDNQHVTESRLCTPICRTSKAKPLGLRPNTMKKCYLNVLFFGRMARSGSDYAKGGLFKVVLENSSLRTRLGRSEVFAKLVLEGQINVALPFLRETSNGGVLILLD